MAGKLSFSADGGRVRARSGRRSGQRAHTTDTIRWNKSRTSGRVEGNTYPKPRPRPLGKKKNEPTLVSNSRPRRVSFSFQSKTKRLYFRFDLPPPTPLEKTSLYPPFFRFPSKKKKFGKEMEIFFGEMNGRSRWLNCCNGQRRDIPGENAAIVFRYSFSSSSGRLRIKPKWT